MGLEWSRTPLVGEELGRRTRTSAGSSARTASIESRFQWGTEEQRARCAGSRRPVRPSAVRYDGAGRGPIGRDGDAAERGRQTTG